MKKHTHQTHMHVNDIILWAGAWGSQDERLAIVTSIDANVPAGSKEGTAVDSIPWRDVAGRNVIVGIETSDAIYPRPEPETAAEIFEEIQKRQGPLFINPGIHWAWADQIRRLPVCGTAAEMAEYDHLMDEYDILVSRL